MKVLVTGHRGYIGSVLVPLLLARDHEVHGLDTDLFRACTFDGELASIPEIIGDVRDTTIDQVRGYDAIIHLAGLSNDPLGDYNPSWSNENIIENDEGEVVFSGSTDTEEYAKGVVNPSYIENPRIIMWGVSYSW